MFTHVENRKGQFSDRFEGRTRRNDRRAAIARKSAFLIDGLNVKAL